MDHIALKICRHARVPMIDSEIEDCRRRNIILLYLKFSIFTCLRFLP